MPCHRVVGADGSHRLRGRARAEAHPSPASRSLPNAAPSDSSKTGPDPERPTSPGRHDGDGATRRGHHPTTTPDHDPALVLDEDGLARPAWAATDPLLREYYVTEWGMPVRDEQGMLGRISLESQAGLSWVTILRKRPAFREASDGFAPEKVARYGDDEFDRPMADPGIENRAKIRATITNANATLSLREKGGLSLTSGGPSSPRRRPGPARSLRSRRRLPSRSPCPSH